jgi:hypothetical protein
MLQFLSRHRVFAVYLLSLGWLGASALMFAINAKRGGDNVALIASVMAGVALVYAGAWWLARRLWPQWTLSSAAPSATPQLTPALRMPLVTLVGLYAFIVTKHFALIGYVPIIEAISGASELDVSIVRQGGYFDLPGFMRYASDYSAKALAPALLLVTYYFRSRLFWVVLVIGVFYSTGLFARILPIMLLAPLLLLMLTQRRWLHAAAVAGLLCFQLAFATAVATPVIRAALNLPQIADSASSEGDEGAYVSPGSIKTPENLRPPPKRPDDDWRRTSILYSFYDRMVLVPGQVIDQWFQYYAEPEQRESGCGYRVVASVLGCSYVPIPSKLYAAFYQDNAAQGMRGSLNAASFMTEYANFGPAGFLLSALMGGLMFAAVSLIYRDHPFALPMNLPLIVIAMETSLLTAVNSGSGWLVMTAVFIVFSRLPAR